MSSVRCAARSLVPRSHLPVGTLGCVLALMIGLTAPALAGVVHLHTYQGPITPVSAEYLVEAIEQAEDELAAALVIRLDTPGGLDTSMRDIVKAELSAEVPVIVYVAPSGSRAASAGAFITLAAHIAAMAPSTNIGSASPVQMGGGDVDSTMAHKIFNDAAAYIESIADQRGRNAEVARAFVETAVNVTAAEAVEQDIIDLVADDVGALLEQVHGMTVTVDGKEQVLDTADATVVEFDMSPRQKLLKRLADPNVAYVLMMMGIYGLFFELSNPGSLAPGILGGICLLLALFAFQALPVDYTGVALILLGVVLLILEVKVTSYGALSIGGIAALVLGSLMLFDSPEQWARLSLRVMIPSVAVFGGFFILCIWLVVRGQKRPPALGPAALIGETGRIIEAIDGIDATGKVVFHGEIWNAAGTEAIPNGAQVRVTAIEGRLARVEPLESDAAQESAPTGASTDRSE